MEQNIQSAIWFFCGLILGGMALIGALSFNAFIDWWKGDADRRKKAVLYLQEERERISDMYDRAEDAEAQAKKVLCDLVNYQASSFQVKEENDGE